MTVSTLARLIALPLVLFLGLLPWASLAAELVPATKDKPPLTGFKDKPGLRVQVDQPLVLKLGGAVGLMGYRWVLNKGVYTNYPKLALGGREFVVLPVKQVFWDGQPPRGASGSMGSLGACYSSLGHFIAIDIHSGDVLNRGFLRNDIAEHCGGGTRTDWSSSISKILEQGDVKIAWGQDLVDAEKRQAEFKATSAAVAEQVKDNMTFTAKTKIGARVCRADGAIQYIGFTEGVSPDTGKIQIRVADAMIGGRAGSRPGGFQPTIIWDAPDNWEICE